MPKVSARRRLPKGYVYHDKSSKGNSRHHDLWCAEIYFANIRLRKRSTDKKKAQEWISRVSGMIRDAMLRVPADAEPETIRCAMLELKKTLREDIV